LTGILPALSQAIEAEEEREKQIDRIMSLDERKRPYHSMKADESRAPTEEEMEFISWR